MNKRIGILTMVLVLSGSLVGCQTNDSGKGTDTNVKVEDTTTKTDANKNNNGIVAGAFVPTVSTKVEGNKVQYTFVVKNQTTKKEKVKYSNGLEYDYVLKDENGKVLAQLSKQVLAIEVIKEQEITPGQEITYTGELKDLRKGNYAIEFSWRANDSVKASSEFEIK